MNISWAPEQAPDQGQRLSGPRPTHIPATPKTVRWGRLPGAGDPPAATVASGDVVSIDTLSHEGALEDQGRNPRMFFQGQGIDEVLDDLVECAGALPHDAALDGPHFVTGPVAVRGAAPGDLLRIDILDLRRRCAYGVVSNRHAKDVFAAEPVLRPFTADEDLAYEVIRVSSEHAGDFGVMAGFPPIPLRPFLGIMGVAPSGGEHRHSGPPGGFGGNIDLARLVAGTTLFLPVQVADAQFYVGDPHFVQGNGELASTALEAPLTATLRLSVLPGAAADHGVRAPVAFADDDVVVCGLDRDLGRAVRNATVNTLSLLQSCGHSPRRSLLWLSMAADTEVTQVVDGVLGAHLVCPASAFTPLATAWNGPPPDHR